MRVIVSGAPTWDKYGISASHHVGRSCGELMSLVWILARGAGVFQQGKNKYMGVQIPKLNCRELEKPEPRARDTTTRQHTVVFN
jgi:hypothetical protein